ncbi:hypothetical protein D5S17_14885 [Pseudonocardiaceae bacterium YIM PH 21723]|nr:hypothetical protein D5S17_14885 [Pseudonocardiaceae bacterium YIM PH 21723]
MSDPLDVTVDAADQSVLVRNNTESEQRFRLAEDKPGSTRFLGGEMRTEATESGMDCVVPARGFVHIGINGG